MSYFEQHPAITGFGLFLALCAIYWLWRWIRFDENER